MFKLVKAGLFLALGMLSAQLAAGQHAFGDDRSVAGGEAIFYEQPMAAEGATTAHGTVVWSLTAISPAGLKLAWPAIHAAVRIPERNLEFEMTIYRNTDRSLPASHLIELAFRTPSNRSDRSIDRLAGVTMKDQEAEVGTTLTTYSPIKVIEGYFLASFGETKGQEQASLTLLESKEWIDLPVVYHNGRGALLTISKGSVGDEVFAGAIRDWKQAGSP